MKGKTIWALFSTDGEYNPLDSGLAAWWFERPTEKQLMVHVSTKSKANSLLMGWIVENYAYYKLRELYEGEVE